MEGRGYVLLLVEFLRRVFEGREVWVSAGFVMLFFCLLFLGFSRRR